ncbi:hypothetical protein H2200_012730 [Cladophialophora chaetospira]|uniref:CsbD-like domain-containing protein n=1 Tax=Cladophialophora chaetospira TaxID=386627 RepID=A0AA38WXG8_9EURO|nr:hypothetical protein H2200_012730 [Cladophialophora chaetospira]
MSTDQSSNGQASMVGGHVKYVQGAVSSALGYETGEQTKADAVQEMKDAKAQSDGQPAQSSILGNIESAAGKVTGCEGMAAEGQQRIPNKTGIEEQSGTG